MKDKKTRKARVIAKDRAVKPRRGRPKMTDAEKASDPRKIMMGEIKSDLKKVHHNLIAAVLAFGIAFGVTMPLRAAGYSTLTIVRQG